MAWVPLGTRRWLVYLILPILVAIAVIVAGWFSVDRIADALAKQQGYYQLRMLRLVKEGLNREIQQLNEKVQILAGAAAGNANIGPAVKRVDETFMGLSPDVVQVDRYDALGNLVGEVPPGRRLAPQLTIDQLKELVDHQIKAKEAIGRAGWTGQSFLDANSLASGLVGFTVPLPAALDERHADEPAGYIQVWFSSHSLFDRHMIPTHLLPESYSFVMGYRRVDADQDLAPTVVWHFAERQWAGARGGDADEFLAALKGGTNVFGIEAREDWKIVDLPGRDGKSRREVLAYVYIVFGTHRWVLCLSTPYDAVVAPTEQSRFFLVMHTFIALAIVLAGTGLLYLQRMRLISEASEQRRRQLRELDHSYLELFAQNPTAIFVLNEAGVIVDCNLSAERLVGLPKDEVINARIADMFEENTIAALWEPLRRQGNLHVLDQRLIRRRDQEVLLVEVWGRRIGEQWILMAHDVEQRREIQQQLARLKRMESVGSLASALAHDFNNILGQIQILVSNLRSDVPSHSDIANDLAAIEEKVDDASQLVGSLLESREIVLSDEPLAVGPSIREFAASEKRLLPANIELSVEIRREPPPVWITPQAFRRILNNLCLNARDAMPNGGTLTLRVASRDADGALPTGGVANQEYAVIDVEDSGVGMSTEMLDTVFEPFFTTKKSGKGTGLGLWTVYQMLRQAGGGIHVRSRLGRGTCFTVFLPGRPVQASAASTNGN